MSLKKKNKIQKVSENLYLKGLFLNILLLTQKYFMIIGNCMHKFHHFKELNNLQIAVILQKLFHSHFLKGHLNMLLLQKLP